MANLDDLLRNMPEDDELVRQRALKDAVMISNGGPQDATPARLPYPVPGKSAPTGPQPGLEGAMRLPYPRPGLEGALGSITPRPDRPRIEAPGLNDAARFPAPPAPQAPAAPVSPVAWTPPFKGYDQSIFDEIMAGLLALGFGQGSFTDQAPAAPVNPLAEAIGLVAPQQVAQPNLSPLGRTEEQAEPDLLTALQLITNLV